MLIYLDLKCHKQRLLVILTVFSSPSFCTVNSGSQKFHPDLTYDCKTVHLLYILPAATAEQVTAEFGVGPVVASLRIALYLLTCNSSLLNMLAKSVAAFC